MHFGNKKNVPITKYYLPTLKIRNNQGRPSELKTAWGVARNFRESENHGSIWAPNLPLTFGEDRKTTSVNALVAPGQMGALGNNYGLNANAA